MLRHWTDPNPWLSFALKSDLLDVLLQTHCISIINFGQRGMMERLNGEDKQDELPIEIKDPELRVEKLKRQGPSKPDYYPASSPFARLVQTSSPTSSCSHTSSYVVQQPASDFSHHHHN